MKFWACMGVLVGFFGALSGCSTPTMKLEHLRQVSGAYEPKGTVSVAAFEDRRPQDERKQQRALNTLSPLIWSGRTQPEAGAFLQEAIRSEIERTCIFRVGEPAEYELGGYVTSLKATRRCTLALFFFPPLHFPELVATVRYHAVLRKAGSVVMEEDISHVETTTYWGMTEFSLGGISRRMAQLLDKAVTASIKELFVRISSQGTERSASGSARELEAGF